MRRRRGRHLGLVVDERAIRVADTAGRVTEVTLDAEAIADPVTTGQALRRALDDARLAEQAVVIGVPARWLAVRSRAMPPADGEALAGAVRLAAEREFPGRADRLAIDYTPETTTADARQILLCALPTERLAWVRKLAEAAKLQVEAITPIATAAGRDGLMLHLAPGRCELSLAEGGRMVMLRHLNATLNGVAADHGDHDVEAATRALGAEVRRALVMLEQPVETMHIDDGIGLGAMGISRIGGQLDVDVEPVTATDGAAPRFGPALRLAAIAGESLDIDFAHARTQRAPRRRLTRPMRYGLLAAVVALVIVGWYVVEVVTLRTSIARDAAWQKVHSTELTRASNLRDDLRTARGWVDERPGHLERLRQITLAFPERGDAVATNVTLNENGQGVVTGRARNERDVLELLDRIQASDGLAGAKLVYVREADSRTREVAFQINLAQPGQER